MGFAVSGFSTIAQNYISRQIASNFYKKAVFLAVLGALSIGNQKKTALNIGRPNSAEVLSGKAISPAQKLSLQGINEYVARIQSFKTTNTAALTSYGNMPTVANPTTAAHSQAMQAGAKFHWTDYANPILIWEEDELRAGNKESSKGQGIAMSQIIDEATEVGMQDLIDTLANDVWNGNPASQSADLWNQPLGILQALDTTNVYGLADRSDGTIPQWCAQKDTTARVADISVLLDDINLTKGLGVYGNGASLILTNTTLYQKFKNQIVAKGGSIMQNGLPEFGQLGIRKELLQKDNCYIAYDPYCPANTVCAFDMTAWKFIVHPQFNFKVTPFEPLWTHTEGGKRARQAYVRLRFMLTCDNPYLQARYTNVS